MTKHLFSVILFALLGFASFSASALGACVMKPQVMGQPQQCWGDPDLSANNGGYRHQGREVIVLREQPLRPAPVQQQVFAHTNGCYLVERKVVDDTGKSTFVGAVATALLGVAFAPSGHSTEYARRGGAFGAFFGLTGAFAQREMVQICPNRQQTLVNQGSYGGSQVVRGGETTRRPASCKIGGVEQGDLTLEQCEARRESLRVVRPASTTPVPSGNPVVGVNHCKTITENFASGGARTKTPRPENAARGCEILKQMLGSGQLAWNDL